MFGGASWQLLYILIIVDSVCLKTGKSSSDGFKMLDSLAPKSEPDIVPVLSLGWLRRKRGRKQVMGLMCARRNTEHRRAAKAGKHQQWTDRHEPKGLFLFGFMTGASGGCLSEAC